MATTSIAPSFKVHGRWRHYVMFAHRCNGVLVSGRLPGSAAGWRIVAIKPLTVQPSISCSDCGLHGFIVDGTWKPV